MGIRGTEGTLDLHLPHVLLQQLVEGHGGGRGVVFGADDPVRDPRVQQAGPHVDAQPQPRPDLPLRVERDLLRPRVLQDLPDQG